VTPRQAEHVRFALVHALQLPAIIVLIWSPVPWAAVPAGIWGSLVTCAGTDSGWRWRNRVLVAEAVVWLSLALSRAF
jgi:branched-subunit amino acid transport protein